MFKGTLICTYSDKDAVNDVWLAHTIENFTLNPEEWKLVFVDSSDSHKGSLLFDKLVEGLEFTAPKYIHYHTKTPEDQKHYDFFMKQGTRIGKAWNKARKHVVGDLVLVLEDDILIPKYGFEHLINDLDQHSDAGMVGAVQRPKDKARQNIMYAWNDGDHVKSNFFDDESLKVVGAVATGMVVMYAKQFVTYNMGELTTEYFASQDIAYGHMLKDIYGMSVYVNSKVEVLHVKNNGGNANLPEHGTLSVLDAIEYKVPELLYPVMETKRSNDAPIFICGFSGRVGTTWIQRILDSHPDIVMSGETQGTMTGIETLVETMFGVHQKYSVKVSNKVHKKYGGGGFAPNVQRYTSSQCKNRKNIMMAVFNQSYSRMWGIKSIWWSPTRIIKIFRSFPKASFIFITRDIDEVRNSHRKLKKWWNKDFTYFAYRHKVMNAFMKVLPVSMHSLHINQSEARKDPRAMCDQLEEFLRLEPNSLDKNVAKLKVDNSTDRNQTPIV